MKGKPHRLNSKADYYYVKDNFEKDYWKPLWQNMYDLRMVWMPGELLESKEDGIEDETHRINVIESDITEEETPQEEAPAAIEEDTTANEVPAPTEAEEPAEVVDGEVVPEGEEVPAAEEPEAPKKKVTYQQETYMENPWSDFVRFGFTVEEVEAALAE
jgi:hypothetical protein